MSSIEHSLATQVCLYRLLANRFTCIHCRLIGVGRLFCVCSVHSAGSSTLVRGEKKRTAVIQSTCEENVTQWDLLLPKRAQIHLGLPLWPKL